MTPSGNHGATVLERTTRRIERKGCQHTRGGSRPFKPVVKRVTGPGVMNLMQRHFGPESQRRDEVKFLGEMKITTS